MIHFPAVAAAAAFVAAREQARAAQEQSDMVTGAFRTHLGQPAPRYMACCGCGAPLELRAGACSYCRRPP